MALSLTTQAKNAALDSIVDLIDTGIGSGAVVKILTEYGSELATLPLSDPAFGSALDGVVSANSITADTSINAGTASKFKVYNKGGAEILSGTVTSASGGGDLLLTTTNLIVGDSVTVSSFSLTI